MQTLRQFLKKFSWALFLYRLFKIVLMEPLNRGRRFEFCRRFLWWYLWAKPRQIPTLILLENGMKSKVYPDSDSGVSNIFTRNVDYYETQFIRSLLKPGDFIVDAGCNVGNRTLILADLIGGALLFDANPICLERLRENFSLNQIDMTHYYPLASAVGAEKGSLYFSDMGGTHCSNHIVSPTEALASREVPLTTVDLELASLNESPCRFIKFDLEGFDLDGLKGAEQTLRSGQVYLVEFERWSTVPLIGFSEFFGALGWVIFSLDTQGKPTQDPDIISVKSNLFAMSKERLATYF